MYRRAGRRRAHRQLDHHQPLRHHGPGPRPDGLGHPHGLGERYRHGDALGQRVRVGHADIAVAFDDAGRPGPDPDAAGDPQPAYAVATGLNIDPGTSSANTYDVPQCSVAQPDGKNNGKYILGSRDVTSAASFGAGQPIDCGVTYTAPGPYQLNVSVGWSACWAPGTAVPGGPPANCNPNFPGAAGLRDSTTGPVTVNVREIQSVNG